MTILIWTSLIIFLAAFAFFYIEQANGKLTITTKWSELSRYQWMSVAGMTQLMLLLITLIAVAVIRS